MKPDFHDGYAVGFEMAIGECFKSALERERFDAGDLFYNTPKAYEENWQQALQYIDRCVQVLDSSPGHTAFRILVPDSSRTKLIQAMQGKTSNPEFFEMVRTGVWP